MAEAVFADPSWRPGLLRRFVGPTAARRPVERRSAWVFFAPHCHSLDGTSVAGDRSPNQGGCHDRQEHFARKARQRRHNRADRRPCRGSKAAGRATHRARFVRNQEWPKQKSRIPKDMCSMAVQADPLELVRPLLSPGANANPIQRLELGRTIRARFQSLAKIQNRAFVAKHSPKRNRISTHPNPATTSFCAPSLRRTRLATP